MIATVTPIFLDKDADQSVTSSTTLTDDTHLSFAILASAKYRFFASIRLALAGILSGAKFTFAAPASPTFFVFNGSTLSGGTGAIVVPTGISPWVLAAGAGTNIEYQLNFSGSINNGANAGNLRFQFAQNISDGSAITIKSGSFMLLYPL